MTHRARLIPPALGVALLCACVVGPNYVKPGVDAPHAFRGLATAADDAGTTVSLGDRQWWEVFQDEALQDLIRTALKQNYDVQIAAERVIEAEDELGVIRSAMFPAAGLGASFSRGRVAALGLTPLQDTRSKKLQGTFSWDLDFWGAVARASEAGRATLLADDWARQEVSRTLVSNVASAYFELRELDREMQISSQTLTSRRDSLRLTQLLADRGATSMLDVHQAEQLVYTAAEAIPDLQRRIEQQENFLSTLLGQNPGPIARGRAMIAEPHEPRVPGLPAQMLERRPDIHVAEEQLIALNARIGIARAAYFPQISLTADDGYQSAALMDLFKGPQRFWNFTAAVTQPVFEGGRIFYGVKLAETQRQEALLAYRQAIQQAFREVSDALIAYRKDQEFTAQQELLTRSAQQASDLSDVRYKGGATSYLEVLTSQTNSFAAQLGLARAQLNELLALVQLYKSLGGGWQQ